MSQRAVIEAAWGAVTSSVVRRDPAAAGAAVPAAVREGLLQTAGPAALLALQSSPAGREAEALLDGLRDRDWTGDDVLIELLTAAATGTETGRAQLQVELEMLGDVLNDQRVNGQVEVPAGGQVEVPAPRGCLGGLQSGSSSCSGFAHAVGVALGDDDVGVVEEPVEQADRGGVLG